MFFGTKYPIFGKFLFSRNLRRASGFFAPAARRRGGFFGLWPQLIKVDKLCRQEKAQNQI